MVEALRDLDRGREVMRRYGALAVTCFVFFVVVYFSFQVLFDHKRLIEKESKINIWFLAQTEIEFLRLKEGLKDFALGDPNVDRKAIAERFEMFWSRLPILLHGPQSANLRQVEGVQETAAGAIADLEAIEPLIQSLDRNDREGIDRIDSRLDELRQPLHDMVQRALTFDADLSSKERKAHELYYYQLLGAFAALLVGGVALFLMFYRQILRAHGLFLQAREAEAEARKARQQLVVAIGSVSEGFILCDEHDRVVLFNERYRELHPPQATVLREGVTFAELAREAVRRGGVAVLDGDAESWVERCVETHRNPGDPFESRLSNGTWLKISERRTADGGIVGVHTDITELKCREAELRRNTSLLRATLNNINQGIAVFDGAKRLVTWNDRFVELHGLPLEFVRAGLSYKALVRRYAEVGEYGLDPIERHVEAHLRAASELDSGASGRKRFERRRPNGTVIEITFDPMPDGGFIKTYADITERVRAEEERTRLLEEEVEERTRQLRQEVKEREDAQAQLAQSQKVESVGQLTGGVAHDFNNLLTAVIGNLDLLDRHVTSGAGRKLLRGASRAAERGASLTQRLLAFARRQRLEPQAIDVSLHIPDMHDLLARSLGPAVRIAVSATPDLWPALVDPHQLELVILNVAINARDAMPSGGSLTIAMKNARAGDAGAPVQLAPGDYVVVSVSDTGTGMGEATLARVFEPFFTTKGVGKGTGLGLAMVHGIAAQSGGAACIRSKLGEGTTVEVWLPRAAARHSRGATRMAEIKPAVRGQGTVLLCDDEPRVREYVADALRDYGYDVVETANGRAALMALEGREPVDLLVVDFAMPEMNGGAVARAARERRPNLPVLIITGYAETQTLAAEAKGLPILHKPFKPAALAARVAGLLQPELAGAGLLLRTALDPATGDVRSAVGGA